MWDALTVHPSLFNRINNHLHKLTMLHPTKKISLLLLLLSCTMLHAAERYTVKITEAGNMYFFMPYKLKGNAGSKLLYDMTLLSLSDTVSINMTLTAPQGRVRSISLSAGAATYCTEKYELYFQERNGSRFDTRIHIDCPIDTYKQIYTSDTPLSMEITMEDGKRYTFIYKAKKWKKETAYISEVFEIIKYHNSRQ